MLRLIAPGLLVVLGSIAEAQQRDTSRQAAIVLRAEVSAREVRFTKQPTIRVHLYNGNVDTVRVIERRNLPDPVQPGVTYHDVFISVEVLGHLNADCLARRITGQDTMPCARRDSIPRRQ